MFKQKFLAAILLLAFGNLGCDDSAGSSGSGGCKSDSDCSSGYECIENACTDQTPTPDAGSDGSGGGEKDMGPDPKADMGSHSDMDPGKTQPFSYHTFSVGSGKMTGGGYKAKVRITSSPAGKQSAGTAQHKVGAP